MSQSSGVSGIATLPAPSPSSFRVAAAAFLSVYLTFGILTSGFGINIFQFGYKVEVEEDTTCVTLLLLRTWYFFCPMLTVLYSSAAILILTISFGVQAFIVVCQARLGQQAF